MTGVDTGQVIVKDYMAAYNYCTLSPLYEVWGSAKRVKGGVGGGGGGF